MRLLVVTPTLGRSRFLPATIASVATNTLPYSHVIITKAEVLHEMQRRYPQITVIAQHSETRGIYDAIGQAVAFAEAQDLSWTHFTFINDDDYLAPGFSEPADSSAKRIGQSTIVYGRVNYVDEKDRSLGEMPIESNPSRIRMLLRSNIVPLTQQGTIVPRSVYETLAGFSHKYSLCADTDFFARAVAAKVRFVFNPKVVATFRFRYGQLSSDVDRVKDELRRISVSAFGTPLPRALRVLARAQFRARNIRVYLGRALKTKHLRSEALFRNPRP